MHFYTNNKKRERLILLINSLYHDIFLVIINFGGMIFSLYIENQKIIN